MTPSPRRGRPWAAPLLLALAACGGGPPKTREPFERAQAYAISHVLVGLRAGRTRGAAEARMEQIRARLDAGTPFAEVAREMSDDEVSREDGGFLGFLSPFHETRFAGAIQILEPGETRGPLHSQVGMQMLHRHPYEEGRAIERRTRIPVHGFVLTSKEAPGAPSERTAEEALRVAEEAHAKVRAGAMTLAEAAAAYGDVPPRTPDALLDLVTRKPATAWLFAALEPLPEGALAPQVVRGPGVFAVVARGRLLRSIARHILVSHVGSQGRDLSTVVRRTPEEARERALAALAEAREDGSNWAALVTKYSDDVATVSVQGSLGVVGNGVLQPELERLILDTPPGRVARAVAESPAGFHLAFRVD